MESVTDTLPAVITLRPRLSSDQADPGFLATLRSLGLDPEASSWQITPTQFGELCACFGLDVDLRDVLDMLWHVQIAIPENAKAFRVDVDETGEWVRA